MVLTAQRLGMESFMCAFTMSSRRCASWASASCSLRLRLCSWKLGRRARVGAVRPPPDERLPRLLLPPSRRQGCADAAAPPGLLRAFCRRCPSLVRRVRTPRGTHVRKEAAQPLEPPSTSESLLCCWSQPLKTGSSLMTLGISGKQSYRLTKSSLHFWRSPRDVLIMRPATSSWPAVGKASEARLSPATLGQDHKYGNSVLPIQVYMSAALVTSMAWLIRTLRIWASWMLM
mmetsp:Transcript_124512/g.346640  ORF Transcript_124512/g.346640 Transcript_124512/m.346640 type:complete len:231 (+) Transcript_124512:2071-2763(+)